MRHLLVSLFLEAGYRVSAVSSGAALLEAVSASIVFAGGEPLPDLIITDIQMPGFSVLKILEGLRAFGCAIPVVVISAYADEALRARLRKMSKVVFLDKPLDLSVLEESVRFALTPRR